MFHREYAQILGSFRRGLPTALLFVVLGCQTKPLFEEAQPSDRATVPTERTRNETIGVFPGGERYPLAVGNHWTYDRTVVVQFTWYGEPLPSPEVFQFAHELEHICQEQQGERLYFVQEERWTDGKGGGTWWTRLREETERLREADVALTTPPDCAQDSSTNGSPEVDSRPIGEWQWQQLLDRGAVRNECRDASRKAWESICRRLDGGTGNANSRFAGGPELIRLKYPLDVGQSWFIRRETGLDFWAKIEAREQLNLPLGSINGYRLRIRSSVHEENDSVLMWYGACGLYRLQSHFEAEITDENGVAIGRIDLDELQELEKVDLVEGEKCATEWPNR